MDTYLYSLRDLIEVVRNRYPSKSDLLFSILFVDKHATDQSFIDLHFDDKFMAMLNMYEDKKEVTTYVTTTDANHDAKERQQRYMKYIYVQERIELKHMMSPKEGINVVDVMSLDIMKGQARIRHLKHLKVHIITKRRTIKGL